jgi:hypothetical protein
MSIKIDEGKKRLTKAEAQYLFRRPWMTSAGERKQLAKMLAPKQSKSESEPEEEESEDEE